MMLILIFYDFVFEYYIQLKMENGLKFYEYNFKKDIIRVEYFGKQFEFHRIKKEAFKKYKSENIQSELELNAISLSNY